MGHKIDRRKILFTLIGDLVYDDLVGLVYADLVRTENPVFCEAGSNNRLLTPFSASCFISLLLIKLLDTTTENSNTRDSKTKMKRNDLFN